MEVKTLYERIIEWELKDETSRLTFSVLSQDIEDIKQELSMYNVEVHTDNIFGLINFVTIEKKKIAF